jgi:anthranilate synthase
MRALNDRGRVLLPALRRIAVAMADATLAAPEPERVALEIDAPTGRISEEERSRVPSVFSLIRAIVGALRSDADPDLGLFGAFGYDLAIQFEPIPLRHTRDPDQRDLVLYLPDDLVVVDHRRERSHHIQYEFVVDGVSTEGLAREGNAAPFRPGSLSRGSDHEPGEYAQVVRRARSAFARGDLFEVVPSQVFSEGCAEPPSRIFRRLRERNPSPYGFLLNLGDEEYLVGASPEMYVRVGEPDLRGPRSDRQRRRVETCPIAGTIARGRDPLEDADQILALLSSEKDACELTMCTDVDRNDKSRVCVPGSVRVIGRRQIELYSRLIHTVDHVEGLLREDLDALGDALHRGRGTVTTTLLRWSRGRHRLRRAAGHGPGAANDPDRPRHCRDARRRHAAPRLGPRRRRGRDATQGIGPARRPPQTRAATSCEHRRLGATRRWAPCIDSRLTSASAEPA